MHNANDSIKWPLESVKKCPIEVLPKQCAPLKYWFALSQRVCLSNREKSISQIIHNAKLVIVTCYLTVNIVQRRLIWNKLSESQIMSHRFMAHVSNGASAAQNRHQFSQTISQWIAMNRNGLQILWKWTVSVECHRCHRCRCNYTITRSHSLGQYFNLIS